MMRSGRASVEMSKSLGANLAQQVAHAAANQISLVSGRAQPCDHLARQRFRLRLRHFDLLYIC